MASSLDNNEILKRELPTFGLIIVYARIQMIQVSKSNSSQLRMKNKNKISNNKLIYRYLNGIL